MVAVEADVSDGLPGFSMVGYLAAEEDHGEPGAWGYPKVWRRI